MQRYLHFSGTLTFLWFSNKIWLSQWYRLPAAVSGCDEVVGGQLDGSGQLSPCRPPQKIGLECPLDLRKPQVVVLRLVPAVDPASYTRAAAPVGGGDGACSEPTVGATLRAPAR
ncbi:hypothetical protein MTO96_013186 [Rhipicephalus appendiculatus]